MTEGAAYLCVHGVASTACHGQPRSPIQLIPTPAQYSGLPKRTSRGTSSASAAENFMAVRVWGRLRGGVKAAADAMTIAAECLSILKRMSRASFAKARQLCHRFAVSSSALRAHRAGSERPIAGVEARRIETKRCREDECLKTFGRARAPSMRQSHSIDAIAC